ncbi:MAG: menaquinone biosynthesis decarboxylase [Alistipes sp.]|nr:menaquinone biosynthesis decarboxylase [Alistipes sp.]
MGGNRNSCRYDGLRAFLERLEREGELVRVAAQVSAEEEIAEITDRMSKSAGGGKALLFENTGTEFPVVTNMFGSPRRMALALGVERLEELGERLEKLFAELTAPKENIAAKLGMLPLLAEMSRWMPRNVAGRGACQQVVMTGDEVDLERLPVLKCWPHDGGRFITLPMVNTVDPDTGIRNVGMYRMQLFDARTTGMHWHIHKTGARHCEAWRRAGRRMPVVVTLGGDPAYTYAATAPMPDNMDEYLLAGFLRRRPVRLVRCLTCDIRVPEDCDFVIEGYVDPAEERCTEGPFGDHTGFYSLTDLYPRFHVTAVTHRRDAVYPATLVGIPPQEDAAIAMATERIFLAPIRMALQPEIRDLAMPVAGTAHNLAVVSLETRYEGQAHKVAQSLWGAGQMMFNKYLALVPAETDIRDPHALAALLRRADTSRLLLAEGVYDVLDHATRTQGFGGKAALDMTAVDAAAEPCTVTVPERFEQAGGVVAADASYVAEWGALFLFARPGEAADAAEFMAANGVSGVKYVLLLDAAAEGMPAADLVWLAAADSDPRRDLSRMAGGALLLDGRSKRPGDAGNPARFPNVTVASEETVAKVSARWVEYGTGGFLESPSERYRALLLSDAEKW